MICKLRLALFALALLPVAMLSGPTAARPDNPAQDRTAVTSEHLIGDWFGTYMRDGAALGVEMTIFAGTHGDLMATARIPAWIGEDASTPSSVLLRPDGTIHIEGLPYADVKLTFDTAYRQMFGKTETGADIHFRRMLPRPRLHQPDREEMRIPVRDAVLAGTLHLPAGQGPHPAMLVISGRGCRARDHDLGNLLVSYGMAVLVTDRRGFGRSTGDCDAGTFDQRVDDAAVAMAWLAEHDRIDARRIGLHGTSAGAWIAQGVAEQALSGTAMSPAFIVTFIGPATSVLDQQIGWAMGRADRAGVGPKLRAEVRRALALSVDRALSDAEIHEELTRIRDGLKDAGLENMVLRDSHFPETVHEVKNLWTRRFSFDPSATLSRLSDVPYLSILGEADDIVPVAGNTDRLRKALEAAGNERFRIVAIPGLGHTTSHDEDRITLPDGRVVTIFPSDEPLYFTEMIRFLREQALLPG